MFQSLNERYSTLEEFQGEPFSHLEIGVPGIPACPVGIAAQKKALDEGIYVTGFYYPVVPKGQARIRVQISAGHHREQLDRCIEAFVKIGRELGVLK